MREQKMPCDEGLCREFGYTWGVFPKRWGKLKLDELEVLVFISLMGLWWNFFLRVCEEKQLSVFVFMMIQGQFEALCILDKNKLQTTTLLLHSLCNTSAVLLSLSVSLSPPHSPSLTATLEIHYLRNLQTNLALSHSPHTHTLTTPPQP